MTVVGTAVFVPLAGGLVALGAVLDAPGIVERAGRATAASARPDGGPASTPGTLPAASTGFGAGGEATTAEATEARRRALRTAPAKPAGMPARGNPTSPKPVVATTYVTEAEEIPYRTRFVRDPSLARGDRVVRVEGVPGVRTVRYAVTSVDGRETGRRVVDVTVVREPVTRVIAVGTGDGGDSTGKPCGRDKDGGKDPDADKDRDKDRSCD